jgi:IS30 family transposase
MGFRKHGCNQVPESALEDFLEALRSGLSRSGAAAVAGVSHQTGSKWARAAGVAANLEHRGIRYPAAAREAFWAAMRSGSSSTQAAVIAGVSEQTGRIWVKQAGYVPRTQPVDDIETDPVRRPRAPLTFTERCRLENCSKAGAHRRGRRCCWTATATRSGGRSPADRPARDTGRASDKT